MTSYIYYFEISFHCCYGIHTALSISEVTVRGEKTPSFKQGVKYSVYIGPQSCLWAPSTVLRIIHFLSFRE